jgi:hypothetical protein
LHKRNLFPFRKESRLQIIAKIPKGSGNLLASTVQPVVSVEKSWGGSNRFSLCLFKLRTEFFFLRGLPRIFHNDILNDCVQGTATFVIDPCQQCTN